MIINLFQTPEYKALIYEHISKIISYFFEKQQEFSIVCQVRHIEFSPLLPQEIKDTFDEVVLFIISGYTYESASLDEEYFSFEAGFGENNFGSTVTIPLLAIKQIFIGDNPIVFNLAEYTDPKPLHHAPHIDTSSESIKNSMKTLLNNPENKKLLKRKK